MGQALYRKYRSKSLKEIIGQEHITDTLAEAIKSGRISHAYLFTGPKGVGKTSIARILAHEINGLEYSDQQAHIDIIEIDAASNRRIDEIRELRDKIHVAPAMAIYKVYIIDEVHMLTREAFNALLKTLEEPPAHAIFILATTEAHKLPDTIVSRTQRYVFRPIESTKAVQHLRTIATAENITITDDALALVVEHGDGSFRDSISLLDQLGNSEGDIDLSTVQGVLGIAPVQAIETLLNAIRTGQSTSELYAQLSSLFDQGYQPSSIAKQLAGTLRKMLSSESRGTTNDIALLSGLLEIPLSHDPEASLEVAVLGYNAVVTQPVTQALPVSTQLAPQSREAVPPALKSTTTPPPPKPAKQPEKPVVAVKGQPKKSAVATDPAKEAKPTKTHRADGIIMGPESWQGVLDLLKKQHNTLYGIVRMAQPDFSVAGALHLSFGFAFHQKRANEARNRTIIADAVTKVVGGTMQITCTYDSEAKTGQPVLAAVPENAVEAAPGAAPLSTISNIFGGVEMVE